MTIEELTFAAFQQGREQGREESAAQIERLRELIHVAHAEGWDNAVDEYSKGGLWDDCWLKSDARAALQPKKEV